MSITQKVIPKYAHKYLLSIGFKQIESKHPYVVRYSAFSHNREIVVKVGLKNIYSISSFIEGRELVIAHKYTVNNRKQLEFLIMSNYRFKGDFHNKSLAKQLLNSSKRYIFSFLESLSRKLLNIAPSLLSV
jgi:hypothetical protein